MVEEKKDLNNSQSVTGQDLNTQSVTEPSVKKVPAVLADGTPQDEKTVPYDRFKEANEKAKAAEEAQIAAEAETKVLREHAALTAAAQTQTQVQSQIQQPLSTYEQAMKDCDVDPGYMTEPERTKVFARKEQLDQARNIQQANQYANQSFIASHPDYSEAVGKIVAGQTIPSAEITEILQRKPYLTAAAYSSAEGAYKIVMDERELKKLTEKTGASEEFEAQQKADAKTGVMSSAGVGGAGAVDSGQLPRATTQEQQEENDRRVAAGEFD